MPRQYTKRSTTSIIRRRGLVGKTSSIRFHQFYLFLVNFCKEVKVVVLKEIGSYIKYRLQLVY